MSERPRGSRCASVAGISTTAKPSASAVLAYAAVTERSERFWTTLIAVGFVVVLCALFYVSSAEIQLLFAASDWRHVVALLLAAGLLLWIWWKTPIPRR